MRILIYSNNYPSEYNLYGNVFVHVRAVGYKQKGHEVLVVGYQPSENIKTHQYIYENIPVVVANNLDDFYAFIHQFQPEVIAVHFFENWMLNEWLPKINCPMIVWHHGYGSLTWRRRLFEMNGGFFDALLRIKTNRSQLKTTAKLTQIANSSKNIVFVYVSNWLKKTSEKDVGVICKNSTIIPNPIDTNLFSFAQKNFILPLQILNIRPYGYNRKYAVEIVVKTILYLKSKPYFEQMQFNLIGDGPLFDKILEPVKQLPNVNCKRKFLNHDEIKMEHAKNTVFLCPTLQDTHGVSMCEAMASGLIPIASNNSAIPEYVTHNYSGLLSNNHPKNIAANIERLLNEPALIKHISANAAKHVRETCAFDMIIDRELTLFKNF